MELFLFYEIIKLTYLKIALQRDKFNHQIKNVKLWSSEIQAEKVSKAANSGKVWQDKQNRKAKDALDIAQAAVA